LALGPTGRATSTLLEGVRTKTVDCETNCPDRFAYNSTVILVIHLPLVDLEDSMKSRKVDLASRDLHTPWICRSDLTLVSRRQISKKHRNPEKLYLASDGSKNLGERRESPSCTHVW
jgi:hypothetical protein